MEITNAFTVKRMYIKWIQEKSTKMQLIILTHLPPGDWYEILKLISVIDDWVIISIIVLRWLSLDCNGDKSILIQLTH